MSSASKFRAKFTSNDTDSSSSDSEYVGVKNSTIYGSSQSNNALLCNFEESALNGRLKPISSIDEFKLQLDFFIFVEERFCAYIYNFSVVSGNFSVPHTIIPVTTYFFDVSDDKAPPLYLGHCSFKDSPFGRKAIHIPKKCIVQATLFNPHGSVVRIDIPDIPPHSKTFIRQRTCATAVNDDKISLSNFKLSILRYFINLRLATDRSGKLYLHTNIRLLFSNDHTDIMNLNASEQQQQQNYSNKRGTLFSSSGKSHNNGGSESFGCDNINVPGGILTSDEAFRAHNIRVQVTNGESVLSGVVHDIYGIYKKINDPTKNVIALNEGEATVFASMPLHSHFLQLQLDYQRWLDVNII
uniref:Atos-like conserved domain-containing protein n=1 Tax=Panagrolaimus sp. PS1159 TaxID=55785 RepID=A0AC35G8A4_9BILA